MIAFRGVRSSWDMFARNSDLCWLKQQIPIRTFTEWNDARPGFLEVDLVAHCGGTTRGFFLFTLCAVDVATSWIELQALWGQGQARVRGGIHEIRKRLPVPLAGLDSDNGSEFINRPLFYYCRREGITLKKNDSAHVEQKNGAIVRQLVGYDRFTSKAAHAQLTRVYHLARLHVNFFQPVQKLVSKTRHGARVHRRFDHAQTPYQRLAAAGCSRAPPTRSSKLSISVSIRCSCGATSRRLSIVSGHSLPPTHTARAAILRLPLPSSSRLLEPLRRLSQ